MTVDDDDDDDDDNGLTQNKNTKRMYVLTKRRTFTMNIL
jgi:hypothetical protein